MLRGTYAEGGFFRGMLVSTAFSVPAASLYLGLYRKFRDAFLLENDGFFASKAAAGAM